MPHRAIRTEGALRKHTQREHVTGVERQPEHAPTLHVLMARPGGPSPSRRDPRQLGRQIEHLRHLVPDSSGPAPRMPATKREFFEDCGQSRQAAPSQHRGRSLCAWEEESAAHRFLRAGELGRRKTQCLTAVPWGRPGDMEGTQGPAQICKYRARPTARTPSEQQERQGSDWKYKGRHDHQRTHNPSAVGSSPTRPTTVVP